MNEVRIGIVGPGAIAAMHAEALNELGVPVVAAAGNECADLEAFAGTFQVKSKYGSAAELVADPEVDAVIVATPSASHVEITLLAIQSMKPVLCEIPLALSASDGRLVADAAAEHHVVAGVAHTLRYWEPHRMLAAELAEQREHPRHVIVRSLMLRQSDAGWTGKTRSWTDSVVWHHGSHAIDAALWFLGEPAVEVSCMAGDPWVNASVMDAAFAMSTADQRIATVDLSYHSRIAKTDFLVIAADATWEISGATLTRDGEVLFSGAVAEVQRQAILEQDAAFLRAIRGDPTGFFSAAEAIPALDVLERSRTAVSRFDHTDGSQG